MRVRSLGWHNVVVAIHGVVTDGEAQECYGLQSSPDVKCRKLAYLDMIGWVFS